MRSRRVCAVRRRRLLGYVGVVLTEPPSSSYDLLSSTSRPSSCREKSIAATLQDPFHGAFTSLVIPTSLSLSLSVLFTSCTRFLFFCQFSRLFYVCFYLFRVLQFDRTLSTWTYVCMRVTGHL